MMDGLTDDDHVIAERRRDDLALRQLTAHGLKRTNVVDCREHVAHPQFELPRTQSRTASASADAATGSFMYGSAQTSTRSSICLLMAARRSLSIASPAQ